VHVRRQFSTPPQGKTQHNKKGKMRGKISTLLGGVRWEKSRQDKERKDDNAATLESGREGTLQYSEKREMLIWGGKKQGGAG